MPDDKPMTIARCTEIRGSCRDNVRTQVELSMTKLTGPIERLEAIVSAMDEKLEGLEELYDRVSALERFKAKHEGRAEGREREKREHSVSDLRGLIKQAGADSHGKIVADLKTRSTDSGILLPRWAVYSSAALLALIVILSAFAGERVAPFIVKIFQ